MPDELRPQEAASSLEEYYRGHNAMFGTAHFEIIAVSVRLVDRGRSCVLCVHCKPEVAPNGKSGLDPVHSFKGFPVAWEPAY